MTQSDERQAMMIWPSMSSFILTILKLRLGVLQTQMIFTAIYSMVTKLLPFMLVDILVNYSNVLIRIFISSYF